MKEDQDQYQDQEHFPALSTMPYDTCLLSCPNLQSSQHEQVAINPRELLFGQQGQEPCVARLSICNAREERARKLVPVRWMSSKIRLMRKMMGEDRISLIEQGISSTQVSRDQAHESNHECCSSSSSNGNIVRACSSCSTTKTPLWRSGPQGPKSLCNACGIRQMKARRAMRAAAAASASTSASGGGGGGGGGGGLVVRPASAPKKAAKVDRATVPFKKRFKIAAATPSTMISAPNKRLRFDDVKIALSKKLAFNQAFPQEEKDAAILLMALSYGLIHG